MLCTKTHSENRLLSNKSLPVQIYLDSNTQTDYKYSLISRSDKVELIVTEFFQQSCDCLGYLKQHTKSCKFYLVGKYIYFRLKNDHFYA